MRTDPRDDRPAHTPPSASAQIVPFSRAPRTPARPDDSRRGGDGGGGGIAPDRGLTVGGVILLIAAAFAIRSSQFGNPLIQVDENFYLLVGDRLLHGALPYVDIWDRKPFGLFLLFAAIRLIGGTGIVQYQVVATVFSAATAMCIAHVAGRIASRGAAIVAGLLYLLLLGLVGGGGGQAPVFYNLFVALAGAVTLRCVEIERPSEAQVRTLGAAAMALCGIAMQIKYNAVFEGLFFGLVFTGLAWRTRAGIAPWIGTTILWIAIALLPTALAWAYYAWRGQAGAFVYANFLSIGARSGAPVGILVKRIGSSWTALNLPIFCVLLSAILAPWRDIAGGPRAFGFVMLWLGAALAGYLLFGTYFNHYALPLLVPITIGAAPLFGVRRQRIGPFAAGVMLIAGTIAYAAIVHANHRNRGGASSMAAQVAAIRARQQGCLFVYDGDPILYHLTGSCIPTRYAFPSHLTLAREAGAIGIDPLVELRRILAGRPHLIVDTIDADESEENPLANRIVRAALQRDYRAVARFPRKGATTILYQRLPGR